MQINELLFSPSVSILIIKKNFLKLGLCDVYFVCCFMPILGTCKRIHTFETDIYVFCYSVKLHTGFYIRESIYFRS